MKDKNKIHHEIKKRVRSMRATYNKAKDEIGRFEENKAVKVADKDTQTTPKDFVTVKETNKRSREVTGESPRNETPKRRKESSTSQRRKALPAKTKRVERNQDDEKIGEENYDGNKPWKKVERHKKPRFKKKRPDAMIISAKGDTSYADILRQIK